MKPAERKLLRWRFGVFPLVNLDDKNKESLLAYIDRRKFLLLPNTAGCYNAQDAIRLKSFTSWVEEKGRKVSDKLVIAEMLG